MRVLTFDLEEWFHLLDHPSTASEERWIRFESRIERNLDRILVMLADSNVKATFFCLGWIAQHYPNLVKRIVRSGHEIACHSSRHQLAYNQSKSQFQEDLVRAKKEIEDASGICVNSYRIPGFSLTKTNLWALEIIAEEGFEVDCSVFPASRGHGGLPGFKGHGPTVIQMSDGKSLKELPLNTLSFLSFHIVFSGGGYFRLFPYQILKKLFRESDYVMTYFHPRDFDAEQPVIEDLSLFRKFKTYYGLKSAEGKLRRLMSDFDFIDLRTAVKRVDWCAVPKVKI